MVFRKRLAQARYAEVQYGLLIWSKSREDRDEAYKRWQEAFDIYQGLAANGWRPTRGVCTWHRE